MQVGRDKSSEKRRAIGRGRVHYVIAGAALRESFARARKAKIGKQAWSVLSVIAEQTASYSRLTERIHVARISEATGISERRVRELANVLEAARCIERVKSHGRYASQYSLVLPDDKAEELATMLSGEQGRQGDSGPVPGRGILPPGEQPTEKDGREDAAAGADEPGEFAHAVAGLPGAPGRGKQREEWLHAYREAPQGFLRALDSALQHGKSPPALLTAKIRNREHLTYRGETGTYMLEIHDPNKPKPRLDGPYDGERARSLRAELVAQGLDVIMRKEPA